MKVGIKRASAPNDIYSDYPEDIKEQLEDIREKIRLPDIGVTYLEHLIEEEFGQSSLYFITTFFSLEELQNFIAEVGHRVIISVADEDQYKFFDYEITIYDSWVE